MKKSLEWKGGLGFDSVSKWSLTGSYFDPSLNFSRNPSLPELGLSENWRFS
jgi:hypothetical protein